MVMIITACRKLCVMLEALNKALKESAPVSWSASNRVAIVSDDMLNDEQKAEIMAERAE
jgi:hypothetical protein